MKSRCPTSSARGLRNWFAAASVSTSSPYARAIRHIVSPRWTSWVDPFTVTGAGADGALAYDGRYAFGALAQPSTPHTAHSSQHLRPFLNVIPHSAFAHSALYFSG
jgi:hypothetical protein